MKKYMAILPWISSASTNIFDDLPTLQGPEATTLLDELAMYLSTGRDLKVKDGLHWWFEHKHLYPNLSRMAINYLSIPGMSFPHLVSPLLMHIVATSVDVERTFSQGRLVLSHVRNRLSVQSTRALLCLGVWSLNWDFIGKSVE